MKNFVKSQNLRRPKFSYILSEFISALISRETRKNWNVRDTHTHIATRQMRVVN